MSNESMANQITDVPSAIAELLAVNKELEKELQETKEQLEKSEKVNQFYADKNNWNEVWVDTDLDENEGGDVNCMINLSDVEVENEYLTYAGKQARQYFKDKQGSEK